MGYMLSLKATLDGNTLRFEQNLRINQPRKVIITFLDEIEDSKIDKWEILQNSLSHFSSDFMNERQQPVNETRDIF